MGGNTKSTVAGGAAGGALGTIGVGYAITKSASAVALA